VREATAETIVGLLQRAAGVDTVVACQVHRGKQHVPQLGLDLAGLSAFDGGVQLSQLLLELGSRSARIRPVEADALNFLADAPSTLQRWQRTRYAGEKLPAFGLLQRLEHLPLPRHRSSVL
jgi:hypothetical protein